MIPESYVSGKVSIYKAAAFPEKWEEIKVIANCPCVDTTIQEINNKKYIFTTICENEKTVISSFNDEMFDPNKAQVINNKYNQARSAGKFFTHDEMLIRPAQDCTGEYGKAINLYIPAISNGIYSEKLLKKITADQINTNERIKAAGIHTYNLSEHYEVIDIKRYSFNLVWFIIRPFDYLKRRINRLFNDRNKENNS
ncbi:hypothetical protein SDC9_159010 [bioreactor metagenome]|uniref:Glucosamine inositolphosphorylceramide transferase 1 N-terminal domain-containing protein n=1 Tax=bioreactor metagenome TaxID=1076179 RepID=A0A645FHG7_9ZZZZ